MTELQIFNVEDCPQGSPQWFAARAGIPTASNFSKVLAKGEGKTRRSYMLELAGQILTGEIEEKTQNDHMKRGNLMEPEARDMYAFMHDVNPITVGFMRRCGAGASPDALVNNNGLLEIKTKLPHLQIECLLADRMSPEHLAQVQGQLWISEREWCDFVSYWPKLPLFVKRIYRDDAYIKNLELQIGVFNSELQSLVSEIQSLY